MHITEKSDVFAVDDDHMVPTIVKGMVHGLVLPLQHFCYDLKLKYLYIRSRKRAESTKTWHQKLTGKMLWNKKELYTHLLKNRTFNSGSGQVNFLPVDPELEAVPYCTGLRLT